MPHEPMDKLAIAKRLIGMVSIAVGLAALMAPRRLAFAANVTDEHAPEAIAAYGAKELASGAALLSPVKAGPMLWGRVAGDVLSLVGLGAAARKPNAHRAALMGLAGLALAMLAIDIATAATATKEAR